jgi:hypothetical protein
MTVSKTEELAMENLMNSMNRRAQLEWAMQMARVVTTKDIQGIVADNRNPVHPPAPTIAPATPSERGWREALPLKQPYVDHIDRIAEAFDRRDRAVAKAVVDAARAKGGADGEEGR